MNDSIFFAFSLHIGKNRDTDQHVIRADNYYALDTRLYDNWRTQTCSPSLPPRLTQPATAIIDGNCNLISVENDSVY